MSIGAQTKEMLEMAERESLNIVQTLEESHSAKESGQRPVFNQMVQELRSGEYNAILTWAPDRLSRNAGDLGALVDMMDSNLLQQIRTYGQQFSNTPNEKFLLMILCSQAKLENDNKGVNVKRGIRAKCEQGWRPGAAPMGYINISENGNKIIIQDPERADTVRQMFERAAMGWSGRDIHMWLRKSRFRTRKDTRVTLSHVLATLNNTFYYGEFKYPEKTGPLYKGAHEPIITRELFDAVQATRSIPPKARWGSKQFAFKGLLKCASCGTAAIGEEKFKQIKLKRGRVRTKTQRYIYYHCTRRVDYYCPEPYINENKLIEELIIFMQDLDESKVKMTEKLKYDIYNFKRLSSNALEVRGIEHEEVESDFKMYAMYVLRNGSLQERARFMLGLNLPLALHKGKIILTRKRLVGKRSASPHKEARVN